MDGFMLRMASEAQGPCIRAVWEGDKWGFTKLPNAAQPGRAPRLLFAVELLIGRVIPVPMALIEQYVLRNYEIWTFFFSRRSLFSGIFAVCRLCFSVQLRVFAWELLRDVLCCTTKVEVVVVHCKQPFFVASRVVLQRNKGDHGSITLFDMGRIIVIAAK